MPEFFKFKRQGSEAGAETILWVDLDGLLVRLNRQLPLLLSEVVRGEEIVCALVAGIGLHELLVHLSLTHRVTIETARHVGSTRQLRAMHAVVGKVDAAGQLDQARHLAEQILLRQRNNPAVLAMLGQIAFAENRLDEEETYIASLSSVTISYKGMVMPAALPDFYPDLRDERLESSVCLFHQRFSTNTLPGWNYAQPFRYLAHNGEINSVNANRDWANARGAILNSPLLPRLEERYGSEAVVDLRFEGRIIVQPSPQGTQRRGDSG